MMEPLVSVIIPIYQVESFLKACVDSVLIQSYKNFEIILVDDGSTDSSPMICDTYSQNYANVFTIHQENQGLSAARNKGFEQSKGKYVYFLDSDDIILPETIELLVKQAEHSDADIVFFDASIIEENGSMTDKKTYIRKQSYGCLNKSIQVMNELFQYEDYITCVPMLFIRREYMGDLRFYKGIVYEDVLFTFLLFFKNGQAIHLPAPLYLRRIRGQSITQTSISSKHIESLIVICNVLLNLLSKEVEQSNVQAIRTQLGKLHETIIERFNMLSVKQQADCKEKYYECIKKIEYEGIGRSRRFEELRSFFYRHFSKETINHYANKIKSVRNKKKYKNYLCNIKLDPKRRAVFLIGTPLHGNLGDHLISVAEMQWFSDNLNSFQIVDIPMLVFANCRLKLKQLVRKNDIIAISGGGWLGSLWMHNEIYVRNIIRDHPTNKIVILPQTVYYENSEFGNAVLDESRKIFGAHKFLTLCLRDRKSFAFAQEHQLTGERNKCFLFPDMALYYTPTNNPDFNRKDALMCFRRDREKVFPELEVQRLREMLWEKGLETKDTTTVYQYGISLADRSKAVEDKLKEYSSAKIVITDRLHSMIFSALAGTPCIAFDNKTGKVSGIWEWFSKNNTYIRVVSDLEQAKKEVDDLCNIDERCSFNFDKHKHFNTLRDVFMEDANG